MPSHLRCAAGRAAPAWASIWIVRALSKAQNLPFSAGSTAAYRIAADLVSISPSEVQPGDLRVVYASGGEQGHVQMALGGGAWIECCYGYGVAVNMSNAWMESRPCYYFRYAGF